MELLRVMWYQKNEKMERQNNSKRDYKMGGLEKSSLRIHVQSVTVRVGKNRDYKKKIEKNHIFFKSDFFDFLIFFAFFSAVVHCCCIKQFKLIVSCTLHRIEVPEPVTIS